MTSPFGDASEYPELAQDTPGPGEDPFADGWGSAPPPGSPFAPTPDHSAPAAPPAPAPAPQEQGLPPVPAASATGGDAPAALDEQPVEQVTITTVSADFSPEVLAAANGLLNRLNDDDSTEVILNGPTEALVKVGGRRLLAPEVTFPDAASYHAVLNEILLPFVDTDGRIDGHTPRIEGQLELPSDDPAYPPMLARVHILAPPMVPFAKVTIAKKARYDYDLDGIAATGAMSPAMADFLKVAAHSRLTIVIAGVTGSGKTTLLQAMSHHMDENERIIVVEDTPELKLPISDVVFLNSGNVPVEEVQRANCNSAMEYLVRESMRMRMDRVIAGEVRDGAAYEFLLASNSGADGSITTIHADNPRRSLDKLLALAARASGTTSELTIRREIAATVDLLVQTSLIDGRHVVSAIEEISPTLTSQGMFATQTLFRFDRSRGEFVIDNAPSDELRAKMQHRGATMNPAWFPGGMPV